MSDNPLPSTYRRIRNKYPRMAKAIDELGSAVRQEGPIDLKNAELIKLAAAASMHSEGAVHSHARQARAAGASTDEIHHAIILLTSTIGFPAVMAALSWIDDVIDHGDVGHYP
ncbi:carboxymuconolactone decarboxylase family protein [Pontibacterium sp.]|uniref:carboxymuconolactone decarboxylase family protein n=2 Tax=Pontibacterium sp. TaxID=2036026 RepID=UPI003511D02A